MLQDDVLQEAATAEAAAALRSAQEGAASHGAQPEQQGVPSPRLQLQGSSSLAAALQHCEEEERLDSLCRQHSSLAEAGGGEQQAAGGQRVTVDDDGIVAADSAVGGVVHAQQAWMARQLFDGMLPSCALEQPGSSTTGGGGWHRVDVSTGHYHAHAAIIIRDTRFEGQSRDVFQYLLDHMCGV